MTTHSKNVYILRSDKGAVGKTMLPKAVAEDEAVSKIVAELKGCMFRLTPDGHPDPSDSERVAKHVFSIVNRGKKGVSYE